MDQMDLGLLFVLYKNTVDYNCRNLCHFHFVWEVEIGLYHIRVQIHSLVVVLPGHHLDIFER